MSGLRNPSLLSNPTVSLADGIPLTVKEDSVQISNGVHMVVTSDPDYLTRRQLTAKVRPAVYDPKTGVYGKDKKSLSWVVPVRDAETGKIYFATFRVEREVPPIMDAAIVNDMNLMGVQMCTSADFQDFWNFGTLG